VDLIGSEDEKNKVDEIACLPALSSQDISVLDRPGYIPQHFLKDFVSTAAGPVPIIECPMQFKDHLGTFNARCGISRNDYKVAPGLYGVGNPDESSPVLVSANYKLSFDHLRQNLTQVNAWILVLETFGVNVWCAAGKGTFATDEVIKRVKSSGLEKIVKHRSLILPQLSATGVAAHKVKKGCGFNVTWGPVRAGDIPQYLANGKKSDDAMRKVTFSMLERVVLVPVELKMLLKPALLTFIALFILSGIGPDWFSVQQMWSRGLLALLAGVIGIISGTILTPVLLPWIPGRAFSFKGIISGAVAGFGIFFGIINNLSLEMLIPLVLFTTALSSYLAMNFTGSTPFTSPSGVEKEMKRAMPFQAVATASALAIWLVSAF